MVKILRLVVTMIWVGILWGMLGGIATCVSAKAPEWLIPVLVICGGVTMYCYIALKEV